MSLILYTAVFLPLKCEYNSIRRPRPRGHKLGQRLKLLEKLANHAQFKALSKQMPAWGHSELCQHLEIAHPASEAAQPLTQQALSTGADDSLFFHLPCVI